MENETNSSAATNVIWAIVVLITAGLIFYDLWVGNTFKSTAKKVDVDVNVTTPTR